MHTLTLPTTLRISPNHIYDLRGAFISLGLHSGLKDEEVAILANRHYQKGEWGENINDYPRVHYRVEKNKAVIWAVNEGVSVLQNLMKGGHLENFTIQEVNMPLQPDGWPIMVSHEVKTGRDMKYDYLIHHYVPYDHRSDHEYHLAPTMKDKIKLLEKTLTTGLQVAISQLCPEIKSKYQPKIEIVDIIEKKIALFRTKNEDGHKITNHTRQYTLRVRCNADLPAGFAVGRMKAYGYGVLTPVVENVL